MDLGVAIVIWVIGLYLSLAFFALLGWIFPRWGESYADKQKRIYKSLTEKEKEELDSLNRANDVINRQIKEKMTLSANEIKEMMNIK